MIGWRPADPDRGGEEAVSDPNTRYQAEQRRFHELDAAGRAESAIEADRMVELAGQQQTALRRLAAARGRLTRAQRECDATKVTAAEQRVTKAYAEFNRLNDAVIAEMFAIRHARLDRLGAVLDQMRRTWHAGHEIREALTAPPRPSPRKDNHRGRLPADATSEIHIRS